MSLTSRIERLRKQVEEIAAQEEADIRLAVEFGAGSKDPNATTSTGLLFDVNQLVDQLLLTSSTILAEGIPPDRYRDLAFDMARKIEKLDDWLSRGGKLPDGWRKKQSDRFGMLKVG